MNHHLSTLLLSLFLLHIGVLAAFADDNAHPVTDREPANVMSYLGADWLERADRDELEQPEKVVAAMQLKPGDVVADIGSGSGYFTRRLARAVLPGGIVHAVDIQPEMHEILAEKCEEEGITNVKIVLGETADPKLPASVIDWMLLVDVYHEFQEPVPMLAKMLEALKPGGKVALLEYRLHGDTAAHIKKDHRMSVEQVLTEWEAAGYRLVKRHEFLPTQHMFIFEKPEE